MQARTYSHNHPLEDLLNESIEAISSCKDSASFACSGSIGRLRGVYIRAGNHYGNFTSGKKVIKCAPITVRWDGPGRIGRRTTFDEAPWYREVEESLEDLVQDCQPSKFSYDGKDLLDDQVRKAKSLDASSFSTNFNPYDYGIVQTLAKELMPFLVRAGRQPTTEQWGVAAELYKLNVYSGPGGMFRSHIDTPRGRTQFGSLVVCLPTTFQGGELKVSHGRREQLFHLNCDDADIKWAAFFSDCDHEVLPVTSGHRVTLTYQLYVCEHIGGITQPKLDDTDSKSRQLYRSIRNLLCSFDITEHGIMLGLHSTHRCPHTHEGTYYYERLPLVLKGMDTLTFATFRAFGLTVHVKPMTDASAMVAHENRGKLKVGNFDAFDHDHYVGDEILPAVTWLNERKSRGEDATRYEVASAVTNWIGNETEIEWEYTTLALIAVVCTGHLTQQ